MDIIVSSELTVAKHLQWEHFWRRCNHAYPRQHPTYARIEIEQGREVLFISGEVEGEVKCAGIFSIRPLGPGGRFSFEAYCLRGPAFDDCDLLIPYLEGVLRTFKSLGTGMVRISPYWRYPEALGVESILLSMGFVPTSRNSGRLDTGIVGLSIPESELFASFSIKTRQHIRSAEKFAVEIRTVSTIEESLDSFECLNDMRIQRGLTSMSKGEFKASFEAVLSNHQLGVLVNAYGGGKFLGTLGVLWSPQVAVPAIYAINTENCVAHSKNMSIGPALWWNAILWAKSMGCSWLDVEGYNPDTPRSSHLFHIHEFKKKFRPEPIQIIDQYVSITNGPIYSLSRGFDLGKRILKISKSLPYQMHKLSLMARGNKRTK